MPISLSLAITVDIFFSFSARAVSMFGFLDSMVAVILPTFGVASTLPSAETEIVSCVVVCQGLRKNAPKAISKTTIGQTSDEVNLGTVRIVSKAS